MMGTKVKILKRAGSCIRPEEKENFEVQIEKIFKALGCAKLDTSVFCNRVVRTISLVQMGDDGLWFDRTLFDDRVTAQKIGYDRKKGTCVGDGIVGKKNFYAILVGFALQAQYETDEGALVTCDGEPVNLKRWTDWINCVLDLHYRSIPRNLWATYENMVLGLVTDDIVKVDMSSCAKENMPLLCDYIAIIAVREGYDKALDYMDANNLDLGFEKYINLKDKIVAYKNSIPLPDSIQVANFMAEYRKYWIECIEYNCMSGNPAFAGLMAYIEDMLPQLVVQATAEVYGCNFWELWDAIKDYVYDFRIYDRNFLEKKVSMAEIMEITDDDMLYFWGRDDHEIRLSRSLIDDIIAIKNDYEYFWANAEVLDTMERIERYMDIMEFANREYFQVFTFNNFWLESLEHLQDERYVALWMTYEKMLYDPDMLRTNSILYTHDSAGNRMLKENISEIELCNEARVKLKRFNMMIANPILRQEVFGF